MDDVKRIPTLVQAQVRLHLVETEIKLETTKAANAGRPVTTVESRRLRAQRDRLAEELEAWRYLATVAELPMEYSKDPDSPQRPCVCCGFCSECGYRP